LAKTKKDLEGERDEAIAKHKPCDATIKSLQDRVAQLEKDLKQAIESHRPCDGKIQELQATLAKTKKDLEGERDEAIAKHKPCDDLIARLKRELADSEKEVNKLKGLHSGCDDKIRKLQIDLETNISKLKRLMDEHQECPKKLSELEQQNKSLILARQLLQDQFDRLTAEHDKCKRVKLGASAPVICGIGLRMEQVEGREIEISEVIPNGTCWWLLQEEQTKSTCLEVGDVIVGVNGNRALDVNKVPELVRGVQGTIVEIEVKKKSCSFTCHCRGSGEHVLRVIRNPTSERRPNKLLDRAEV